MAAHRYWQIRMTANGGDVYSVVELQMFATLGGPNVCTGGTGFSNNTLGGYPVSNAFDGVVTGDACWASNNGTGTVVTLGYDFGAANPQDIVEFALTARNGWPYQCPMTGSLQWSDDNVTWTDLFTFNTSVFIAGNETKYFSAQVIPPSCFSIYTNVYRSGNISVGDTRQQTAKSLLGAGSLAINRNHTGLHYSEYVMTALTGTLGVGLMTAGYNTGGNVLIGADNYALAYRSNGVVVLNNVTIATLVAFAQGDRVDMAVDPINMWVWFRVNGGNWNNVAGNDPVTGVGGIDFSSMAGKGRYYAAVGFSASGALITAHLTAADFVGVPPTGYGSYDVVEYALSRAEGPGLLTSAIVPPASAQYAGAQARLNNLPGPSARMFSPAGTITTVSGVVQEAGSPVAGRKVEVFDRNSGDLLGYALSAADGSWSVPCLGRPSVRVVCSDPTTYDSIVYDNVVPA